MLSGFNITLLAGVLTTVLAAIPRRLGPAARQSLVFPCDLPFAPTSNPAALLPYPTPRRLPPGAEA